MSVFDHGADVVVIGAGHNGLIAASYLARAGRRVVLLEARDSVGGCSSTESFGGALVNICNCDHITFRTTPVMEELRLADHGLEYLEVEPNQVNIPWDGGPAWPIMHSVEQTLDALALTYPHQVDAYRRYAASALPVARLVLQAAAAGPERRRLLSTVMSRGGSGALALLRWSRMSAADVMREFFDDESVFVPALATGPVVWGLSPELPGTGLGALTYAFRHVAKVGRPRGGSGMLATSLARSFESFGGTLRTSTAASSIIVERGRVRGVRTASGETIAAPIVISAADPRRTILDWIEHPPAGAGPMIERWRTQGHQQGYESKIDGVIDELPRYKQVDRVVFARLGANPDVASTMIVPSLAAIHRAFVDIPAGRIADRPVFFANVPTALDPTMAPTGRHVFSLEALFTPYALAGGWPGSNEPRRWLDAFSTLLENRPFDSMSNWRAMTPDVYESDFHMPEGHATSFAGGPLAALRGKPRELVRYETTVPGLYLCGAATFPGAGIWGASGRHCAMRVLRHT
jgi:beta-carotene ketolase (CrtO type)